MSLTPRKPPGRLSRKALEFQPEISRLHFEGHTSEAIRQALLDAGLAVSRSTVKREVARLAKRRPANEARGAALSHSSEQPALRPLAPTSSHPFATDPRSSKEIAECFVKSHPTTPLLRSRSTHP